LLPQFGPFVVLNRLNVRLNQFQLLLCRLVRLDSLAAKKRTQCHDQMHRIAAASASAVTHPET
jgi:hypothetical protein